MVGLVEKQMEFETYLKPCQGALERFAYYKMPNRHDAQDLLQEVYLIAYQKFSTLVDAAKFKPWILSIAINKCNDFYRMRMKILEIPLEDDYTYGTSQNKTGISVKELVYETLNGLVDKDKLILYLFYIKNISQKDIAKRLDVPLGTVKSRLFKAKKNFKSNYPYSPILKGEIFMSKFPALLPDINITKCDKPMFEVKFEELPNWFLIPRLGEKVSWAFYDYPEKKLTDVYDTSVIGKIQVHGIDGVEILSTEFNSKDKRYQAVQLTDTHIRYLSDTHYQGDVKSVTTFLDDDFLANWGYGEDNFGRETLLKANGLIKIENDMITSEKSNISDVVGRYSVKISEKEFDTILLLQLDENGAMTESYIDQKGRTVLWRRFNKDDWNIKKYKVLWSEQLPLNERIIINGNTYIHWYSCVSDYIL